MNWPFRRSPPVLDDPQVPLEVHELELNDDDPHLDHTPTLIPWGEKPADLVRAAEAEWTRPHRGALESQPSPVELTQPITVPWRTTPPERPGLYWYSERGSDVVQQAVVLEFGRLCVRERTRDGARYLAVSQLNRSWCGPVAIPEDVTLESLG